MFLPSNAFVSRIDPNELDRIKSGRPASRSEILDRHLREHGLHNQAVVADQPLPTKASRSERLDPAHRDRPQITPNPMVKVRQGISRVLITAGERIGPEAA